MGEIIGINDDYMVIAESNKDRFKCEEWKPRFVPSSSNSKYKYAHCKDVNNNLKQLYVNGQENENADPDISRTQNTNPENTGPDNNESESSGGGGLTKGGIAGIVIAVIVVVAAIIGVLVYFLVFRKKKLHSVNEDDESNQNNSDAAEIWVREL